MSLLQFAKDFAKLKSDLAAQPVPDLQLLCLIDFWPSLADYSGKSLYRSYLDEYVPLLSHLISAENLSDLTMCELLRLRDVLADLSSLESVNDKLKDRRMLVSHELTRRYFYVGAIDDALAVLSWAADLPVCPRSATLDDESVSPGLGDDGVVGVTWRSSTGSSHARLLRSQELPEQEVVGQADRPLDLQDLSEFEAFESVLQWAADLPVCPDSSSLDAFLRNLHDDWIGDRDAIYHDRINALFVDKDDAGRAWRGRMKSLTGKVELFGKSATTDEITFDNQIKSPDDPFIGVAYHSLEAVRQSMKRAGFRKQSEAFYHAHFGVKNSQQTFTGDSIGLATGLLTYAQLLKPEIMRQDKFIGADIAVTGGMDDSGAVTQVNDDTLKLKIERVFFSPVRNIVVPDENLSAAREHIERLREKYPRRRLKLIGVESLTDAIENRNIIREEKVCIGEFVAKKAYRYSRTTKLQIPILLVLAYFLLCTIYPKAWVGFDWNPEYVRVTERGFQALNRDSIEVWSVEYECESVTIESQALVSDINSDGDREVFFIPNSPRTEMCDANANLFVYNSEGRLLFRQQCAIESQYPGDSSIDQHYDASPIAVRTFRGRQVIVTVANRSMPARAHIKFWDTDGELLGWYINAGQSCMHSHNLLVDDSLGFLFMSYNNRMKTACMFALLPDSCRGVSPPYEDSQLDLSWVEHGNQLCYVLFPRTDLNRKLAEDYNSPWGVEMGYSGNFLAKVRESRKHEANIFYYFGPDFRIKNISRNDTFNTFRDSLVEAEILPPIDWSEYSDSLRFNVSYWRDSHWLTETELQSREHSHE